MRFYAVVYAGEWEDIAYFSDFDKAKYKLVVQTVCDEPETYFHPVIYEYNEHNGVFYRSKDYWYLDHLLIKDSGLVYDEVVKNPTLAFDFIKLGS